MGVFDKLFHKKETAEHVYSPVAGDLIALKDFPDPVFGEGVLGPGCGIQPKSDVVKAPFDGKVAALPESLHALGLQSEQGLELLIHIGIDTVTMNGKGFQPLVKQGDSFKTGQELLRFSRSEIEAAGFDSSVAVIVSNSANYAAVEVKEPGTVDYSDEIITVK